MGNPTKRGRVLRATDVIPPFDKNARPPARPRPEGPPCGRAARPGQDDVEIPSYDLAENILAEQRRVAGQRRRRPGPTPVRSSGGCEARAGRPEPETQKAPFGRPMPPAGIEDRRGRRSPTSDDTSGATVPPPTAKDLPALQRVVAEIVARDIQRLCRRPDRSAYVQ